MDSDPLSLAFLKTLRPAWSSLPREAFALINASIISSLSSEKAQVATKCKGESLPSRPLGLAPLARANFTISGLRHFAAARRTSVANSGPLFLISNLATPEKTRCVATTAKIFSIYGAKVIVNYNKGQDEAYRIVEEIKNNGGSAIAIKADISQKQEVKLMVQDAIRHYNTIDILVNNAVRRNLPESFLNITWNDFQHDIDINVKGVFNCCQEVLPFMIKKGSGKIINMGTVMTEIPEPNQTKYISTKSAIVGMTRSLAIEMATYNIQVNMVCPHLVDTDLTKHIPKMFFSKTKNETPLKRLATPLDVANAILFLSSSLSNFTTGQKLMVTGGNAPFF